jgi:DNA replication protein DnaC
MAVSRWECGAQEEAFPIVIWSAKRAERATLIVTTNLPFSEWTQVFPNPRLCKLDRITDRAHIIETGAESYRFRRTMEGRQKNKAS